VRSLAQEVRSRAGSARNAVTMLWVTAERRRPAITVSALATTLFLGGWRAPWPLSADGSPLPCDWWPLLWFTGKLLILLFARCCLTKLADAPGPDRGPAGRAADAETVSYAAAGAMLGVTRPAS
jgi:NADH dehydrogenase